MKRETIEAMIKQISSVIMGLDQAIVFGRTKKEREASELLKDARLKLVEDLEDREAEAARKRLANNF